MVLSFLIDGSVSNVPFFGPSAGFTRRNLNPRQRPEPDLPEFESFGVQTRPQSRHDAVFNTVQPDEGEKCFGIREAQITLTFFDPNAVSPGSPDGGGGGSPFPEVVPRPAQSVLHLHLGQDGRLRAARLRPV